MSESREAFDLTNKACRKNFRAKLRTSWWRKIWFWKLVYSDTVNRVCKRR